MMPKISVFLDTRRIKKNGLCTLKLRVYYNKKAVLYPTIYELDKKTFEKLKARRISDSSRELKTTFVKLEKAAVLAADKIKPFNLGKFYQNFIIANPDFQQTKIGRYQEKEEAEDSRPVPQEWKDRFAIFQESHPFPNSISTVFLIIIKSLLFQSRIGTARSYQTAYGKFKEFRGNVRLSQVTPMYLREFEAWMIIEKENSKTTVGIYTRNMRAVINEAIEMKLMSRDDYPFGRRRYRVPSGRNIKKALTSEAIGKLYYDIPENESQAKAKDFWFFSYYGNGMNVKDIINLKWKNIHGEFLVFERAKTELTTRGGEPVVISCYITEDMWQIIERWGNTERHPDNYVFPILSIGLSPMRQYEIKQNFTKFINKNMVHISKRAGMEKMVKTMETRHSASTIMKNAGVSPHFIKEMLGHTNLKTTENYLAGFEDPQKKIYSKVLDGFKKSS